MFITLLIPCHDESEAVGPLLEALRALPALLAPDHFPEVVFVDDGSTDGTAVMLQAAASRLWFPARVLGLEPNRGIGAAIREGAALAAGEIVVTYDADRAYPLEDIPKLLAGIVSGADVVTASPWHPAGSSTGLSPHRAFLSRAVSFLYRLRLGRRSQGLHTYTCGFRAYRRAVLLASLPRSDGFVSTAEILLNALRRGARVLEVPSILRQRTEGHSKMRSFRTALSHLHLLIRCQERN